MSSGTVYREPGDGPSGARPPLVVVGASAGGVGSLQRFVAELPADLPAAVVVVLHVSPTSQSVLPAILSRAGPLAAHHAKHGETIEAGQIYVAPPDHHLLVEDDHLALSRGAAQNGLRPAVDPLFRSAAAWPGTVIGIVLSGSLDDGTSGLAAIKQAGGLAMVEDPAVAAYPSMPSSARANTSVDEVARAEELARRVVELLAGRSERVTEAPAAPGPGRMRDRAEARSQEHVVAMLRGRLAELEQQAGQLSAALAIPDALPDPGDA